MSENIPDGVCPQCKAEMCLIYCPEHRDRFRWVHMGSIDRRDCLLLVYENEHHLCFDKDKAKSVFGDSV